jgi:hypothetical protein
MASAYGEVDGTLHSGREVAEDGEEDRALHSGREVASWGFCDGWARWAPCGVGFEP